jgi:hypothetical protein
MNRLRERSKSFTAAITGLNERYPLLFLLSMILILMGISRRFPSLSVNAEIFAENGMNLFYHAYHSGVWQNVFERSYYNYLIWLPRLISVVTVKVFHQIEYYHYITQWAGLILIALYYSIFCLRPFRAIIESDIARFLISTSLGIGLLGDYELYAFINFTYHGMFLLLILAFVDMEKSRTPAYVFLLLTSAFIVTSKPHPVVFLPVFGLLCLMHLRMHGRRGRLPRVTLSEPKKDVFYSVTMLFVAFQIAFTYTVNTLVMKHTKRVSEIEFPGLFGDALLLYLKSYLHLLFTTEFLRDLAEASRTVMGLSIAILVLAGLVVLSLRQLREARGKTAARFFMLCNVLAYLNLLILVHLIESIPPDVEWGTLYLPFQNRWFYLSLTCVFLGALVLVLSLVDTKGVQVGITLAAILYIGAVNQDYHASHAHYIVKRADSHSQWKIYHPLAEAGDYCIPIEPYPWLLRRGCRRLGGPETPRFGSIDLPEESESWRIRSAMIIRGGDRARGPLSLVAYGRDGQELGRGQQLTPVGYRFQYFLLRPKISARRFALDDEAGKPVGTRMSVQFMGRLR